MPVELIETRLVLDELTKEERQQFLVVLGLGEVLSESLDSRPIHQPV